MECTYIMYCLQVHSKDFQNMGHAIVAILLIAGLHLIACHDVHTWPDGTYALPKPKSGCPSGGGEDGFSWRTGYIKQDNENSNNKNYCPSPWVFEGYCKKNLKLYYCIKTVTSSDRGIKWPEGSYCIVKKGKCPSGFSKGGVYWDDEDFRNKNKVGGVKVDGVFNRNTMIYYCCRSDEQPHNEIILPTDKPFFLIRKHKDGCQKVKEMKVQQLRIDTDDEDFDNTNHVLGDAPYYAYGRKRRSEIYYCYYTHMEL